MTISRRPRRQGVIYGPPSIRRQPESTTLLGRLIGAIVVIGSLIALLVGALAVIGSGGNRHPLLTTTPSLGGLLSPSPSSSVAFPTPLPTPTPSATPVSSPSPTPTPFPIGVVEGPGKITFGTDYSSSTFKMQNKTVDFSTTGPIAWSANIGTPIGTDQMALTVSTVDASGNSLTVVYTETISGSNPTAIIFLERSRVEQLVPGPGTYVMRYAHNGNMVSEGYFRVNG